MTPHKRKKHHLESGKGEKKIDLIIMRGKNTKSLERKKQDTDTL